jgi:N-acyl amino acid synthase of PEP-CTERM/exosortase system
VANANTIGPADIEHQPASDWSGSHTEIDPSRIEFTAALLDDDPDLLDESYRLRFLVYCVERGFLDPANYPDRLERDEFDRYSLHLGVLDSEGQLRATSRLVQVSLLGLPLFRHCAIFSDRESEVYRPTNRVAEVSRLCMSRDVAEGRADRAAVIPTMYRALYQFSKRAGFTHWLVATERGLHRLLTNFGFPFRPVGPHIDYFGPVAPYIMDFQEFESILLSGSRPHLATFLDGLEPQYYPAACMGVV